MMCYKDKTFCNFDCKDKEICDRSFDEIDKYNAEKLDIPVCFFVKEVLL